MTAHAPIVLDIAGPQLDKQDRRRLAHPLTGGLIFFARHFESRAQLTFRILIVLALWRRRRLRDNRGRWNRRGGGLRGVKNDPRRPLAVRMNPYHRKVDAGLGTLGRWCRSRESTFDTRP